MKTTEVFRNQLGLSQEMMAIYLAKATRLIPTLQSINKSLPKNIIVIALRMF